MAEISEKISRIINDYISEVNELIPITEAFLIVKISTINLNIRSVKASLFAIGNV